MPRPTAKLVAFSWLLAAASCGRIAADTVDLSPITSDVPEFDVAAAPPGTRTLLKRLIVELLPNELEDTKKWGGTKQVWDGLHVRMDGLQVRTKRKWKEVNHGTWKKYRVNLVDPDQFLRAKVSNIHRPSPGQMAFDLVLAAKLNVYGRWQEWQRGVRLFSISADATADVQIDAHFTVETKLDGRTMPPGVIIQPHADSADIRLLDFELHRISKADGPIVEELGDGLRRTVRRALEQRNEKMVERINRQLAKNEEDLHLSVQSMVKKSWLNWDE